ncbi:LegC family aminotransferase [Desulfolutivibrio sulfoxidireducens]|uniref:LegC family aminotransferase n=1 Tax=Desulfolutivibrio sulfoxidireducens TaxID=2773299 RepID=UPI00159D0A47|nr:LegC family aminotransferase [Desulfolutivibrio sulfoxidireducens]QLA17065.1 LegC family aminotransferase [Desulfolutivibrio sulfoxidireducens]QLA20633.1 LegC family aminotransferase [Desulfolutivibrio sulfoxidireducens]
MSFFPHGFAEAFLSRVASVVGGGEGVVPLHEPDLGEAERRSVLACLESTFVSTVGEHTPRFERLLADYVGCREAVGMVNGTAALHMCLLGAGVRPGDEVVLPSLSFVATANAVGYCGAVPHFADVEPQTLCLCPDRLRDHLRRHVDRRPDGAFNKETSRRVAALVPMHAFGHPAKLDDLRALCVEYGLALVEDAAQALGTRLDGRGVGAFGLCGALSFNGNKIITTGGGGAVLTDDPELAAWIRHTAATAKKPHPWKFSHDQPGFNYRLPNLNASLGIPQLRRIEELVAAKRRLAAAYAAAFADIAQCRFVAERPEARSNYWLCTVVLDPRGELGDRAEELRAEVLAAAHGRGLLLRPVWEPLHTLPMYRRCPKGDLGVTEFLAPRIVNLPSSSHLGRALPGDGTA